MVLGGTNSVLGVPFSLLQQLPSGVQANIIGNNLLSFGFSTAAQGLASPPPRTGGDTFTASNPLLLGQSGPTGPAPGIIPQSSQQARTNPMAGALSLQGLDEDDIEDIMDAQEERLEDQKDQLKDQLKAEKNALKDAAEQMEEGGKGKGKGPGGGPPGLAKKGGLPPGLAKKLQNGGELPPGIQGNPVIAPPQGAAPANLASVGGNLQQGAPRVQGAPVVGGQQVPNPVPPLGINPQQAQAQSLQPVVRPPRDPALSLAIDPGPEINFIPIG